MFSPRNAAEKPTSRCTDAGQHLGVCIDRPVLGFVTSSLVVSRTVCWLALAPISVPA